MNSCCTSKIKRHCNRKRLINHISGETTSTLRSTSSSISSFLSPDTRSSVTILMSFSCISRRSSWFISTAIRSSCFVLSKLTARARLLALRDCFCTEFTVYRIKISGMNSHYVKSWILNLEVEYICLWIIISFFVSQNECTIDLSIFFLFNPFFMIFELRLSRTYNEYL